MPKEREGMERERKKTRQKKLRAMGRENKAPNERKGNGGGENKAPNE